MEEERIERKGERERELWPQLPPHFPLGHLLLASFHLALPAVLRPLHLEPVHSLALHVHQHPVYGHEGFFYCSSLTEQITGDSTDDQRDMLVHQGYT